MTLTEARKASDYSEATLVENNIRYSVDGDGVITRGVDGMPASIITTLPASIEQSSNWEPVGEADA